jgi:hypothetical protein
MKSTIPARLFLATFATAIVILAAAPARAAATPDGEILAQCEKISRKLAPGWKGELRETLWLLLALYGQGTSEKIAEANDRLARLLALPVEDSQTSRDTSHRFSMFTVPAFTMLVDYHAELMPAGLREQAMRRLAEMVEYVDRSWEPHHASDHEMGHTNYALLWLSGYLRGSEITGADAIHKKAAGAFHHWCDYTLHNGVTEFNATTYYKIDLHALGYLADRSADPEVRRRAAAFADMIWLDAAIHYWPARRRMTGANARSYSIDGEGGTLNIIRHQLLDEPMEITLGEELFFTLTRHRPPAWFREIALEKENLEYRGLWLAPEIARWRRPFGGDGGGDGAYGNRYGCDRATVITPAWALGTGGDGYAWQDRMLVADFLPGADAGKIMPVSLRINTLLTSASGKPLKDFLGNTRHWPLRTATVQRAGSALVLCTIDTPPRGAAVPVIAPLLIFPPDAGRVELNDAPLEIKPGFRKIRATDILFIEQSGARAALRFVPTGDAFGGQKAAYSIRTDGETGRTRFGLFSAVLYEHLNEPLPRRPAGKAVRIGFVVEMSAVSADASFEAFQRRIIKETKINQGYDGTVWRVDYRTADNHRLMLARDVREGRTLAKEIDGVFVEAPAHRSTISELKDGVLTVRWRGRRAVMDLNN